LEDVDEKFLEGIVDFLVNISEIVVVEEVVKCLED
jgi:hypothetical protein